MGESLVSYSILNAVQPPRAVKMSVLEECFSKWTDHLWITQKCGM